MSKEFETKEEQIPENYEDLEDGHVSDDGSVDSFVRMNQKRQQQRDKIVKEVREKHPSMNLFSVTLPYNGTFVVRPQEISDVKESTLAVDKFVREKIEELGGQDAIRNMEEDQRNITMREIDAEAADISNDISLKRCVMYPYDFAERLDSDEPGKGIPAGVVSLLLDKILEVSGWQEVQIEEI